MDCRPSLQRTGRRKLSLGLGDSQAHLPLKHLHNKLAPRVKSQGVHVTAEVAAEPMCRGTLGSLHACGFYIKNKVLKGVHSTLFMPHNFTVLHIPT